MLIISVDFDGTLALGNKSHISVAEPNYVLIDRLNKLKSIVDVYIKIVTARGAKNKLSDKEKENRYLLLIENFCKKYNVPYDEISFNKEYAHLYIDDMSIDPYDIFDGYNSDFTNNKIIFTENSVIKHCTTSLLEKEWYEIAKYIVKTPQILFCNDELIVTEKIKNHTTPEPQDIVSILKLFQSNTIKNYHFQTYVDNIVIPKFASEKTINILKDLPKHDPTFFHGDLSISNVLKTDSDLYLIDPNYKYIFGSYLTDAGKAFFSYIAYLQDFDSAKQILDNFSSVILYFAVSEGSRVCKYKPEYISIVNNIADLIK